MFWLRLAVPAIVVSLTACLDSGSPAPGDDDRAVAVAEAEPADGDDAVAVVLDAPRPAPPAAIVIPCRTTWPASGEVGTRLRRLADDVEVVTAGRVELRWYFSASSDISVVDRLRSDGGCALLSTAGLASLERDHLILAMPGLFATWRDVDLARDASRAHLHRQLADRHIVWLGDVDFGAARVVGTVAAVAPANLRGRTVAMVGDDPILATTASVLDAVTRALPLGEIITHLGHDLTVVVTSAFQAEQRQWAQKLTHYLDEIVPWFETGGLVIASTTFATLQAGDREQVQYQAAAHTRAMSSIHRQLDADARRRLADRTVVATPRAAHRDAWAAAFGEARAVLMREVSQRARDQVCARVRC